MNAQPNHVLLQPSIGKPIPWYKQGPRAREILDQFPDFTFSHLEWESYAWPGGYPLFYATEDCGTLCPTCANENLMRTIDPDDDQFYIVDADVNWESVLGCDHCGRLIDSAYEITPGD